MEENRPEFAMYLHGALFLVSCILASFGLIGYLRFGSHVQQVISKNLPPSGVLSLLIQSCLVVAIFFTYPLQVYPVVEILERYIFGIGKMSNVDENVDEDSRAIGSPLISSADSDDNNSVWDEEEQLITPTVVQRNEVATWKRNTLRTVVVLLICGLSIVFRDMFAYISSLVGSLGSTVLAYILPCAFHLKIKGKSLHPLVIVKDIFIIAIGLIGGICGLVITIQKMIQSFQGHG